MTNKFLSFRIRPNNITNQLRLWRTVAAPAHFNRAMDKIGREGVRILKTHTPIRTGRLRNSIRILNKIPAKGVDLRSGILIGSRLQYGRYVDQGTKASTGRFVPVLGRRVSTGVHPGIRARNFVQAARVPIEERARMILEDFQKDWGKSLRV